MNRDHLNFAAANYPGMFSEYEQFMSENNVKLISEEVTKLIKERLPSHIPPIKISSESIRNAMWQIYENSRQHPQVMIQIAINSLANAVIVEEEIKELNDSLDPWIQCNPENFGITSYNSENVKINNRRGETIQFTNIR